MSTHLVHYIPAELRHDLTWGYAITYGLVQILAGSTFIKYPASFEITEERPLVAQLRAGLSSEDVARLDALILEEAETLGPQIVLSRLVQWRQSQWAAGWHTRLGKALDKRIREGKKSVVDDPNWAEHRSNMGREITDSGRLLAAKHRRAYTRAELAKAWRAVIDEHPEEFAYLRANLEPFLDFVGNNDDEAHSEQLLRLQQDEPGFSGLQLYDELWGWKGHRVPEKLRQKISRISSEAKRTKGSAGKKAG